MTVYAFDLTHSDISAELPLYGAFGQSTSPTSTQVGVWITEYSAKVVIRLEHLGVADQDEISNTITSSVYEAQYYAIRSAIKEAVIYRVLMSNQEDPTPMAAQLKDDWDAFMDELDRMPWKSLGDVDTPGIAVQTSFTEDRSPYWTRTDGFD